MACETARAAAPLISHFSCWRRSPDERRQLSTCAATNDSQKATSTGKISWSTVPSHAELPAGRSTAASPPPRSTRTWGAVRAVTATAYVLPAMHATTAR